VAVDPQEEVSDDLTSTVGHQFKAERVMASSAAIAASWSFRSQVGPEHIDGFEFECPDNIMSPAQLPGLVLHHNPLHRIRTVSRSLISEMPVRSTAPDCRPHLSQLPSRLPSARTPVERAVGRRPGARSPAGGGPRGALGGR